MLKKFKTFQKLEAGFAEISQREFFASESKKFLKKGTTKLKKLNCNLTFQEPKIIVSLLSQKLSPSYHNKASSPFHIPNEVP